MREPLEDGPTESVLEETRGSVRILWLNRPHRRNAIDLALRTQLGDAVERAMLDDAVRVILLTGVGGTFCSGGDIATMLDVSADEARARTEAAQRVTRLLRTGPKPVIAAVEGAAFGAGMALALACDRIVASSSTRFATAFTRVGLAGDMGITFTLASRVGAARARQLLMFPAEIDARFAEELGLVDVIVEAGQVLPRALDDAERLATGPPLALEAIKAAFEDPAPSLVAALDREAEVQLRLFASQDLVEGASSFLQRRSPQFRGS